MSLELIAKQQPPVINALYKYKHVVFKEGALTVREKELIATAVSCVLKCDTCVETHAKDAIKAGATKEELREAMIVAMYLSGPSAVIFSPMIDEMIK
ncbi:MAG: carboxymuconolactone decarboxylase family protein [Methanomassiliicoccales archaeon]|nr:carboxymuconolactone decarboxylase family protein [Methanomassiliicoccales archaeon]